MTRRLFLHVGLPKTGSTSMQLWFVENRTALAEAGCTYPVDPPLHNYKQGYTVANLRNDPGLDAIRKALEQCPTPDLLLSNEGMSNHFHDFPDETLAAFRVLTADWQVTVIGFYRDPDRWLRSYHRQAVLNPRNNASELWGTAQSAADIRGHYRVQRLLDHRGLADRMGPAFGAAAVHMLDFDQPTAFAEMLAIMDLSALAAIPLPRINEAVPDWVITMMQRINASTPDNAVRQTWKGLLFHYLSSNHTVLRDDARTLTPQALARLDPAVLADMPEPVPVQDLKNFIKTDFPKLLKEAAS